MKFLDSDLIYRFRHSPLVVCASAIALTAIIGAVFAPFLAPHNPFDLKTLELANSTLPPFWSTNGSATFLLGTDDQGRDIFSTILFGSRISLLVGIVATLFAMLLGITLGLLSGYFGGTLDAVVMRLADIQLSFPPILIALLVDGLAHVVLPKEALEHVALYVLIFAIAASGWVRYARTVRGLAMVERDKEYVQAARLIGRNPIAIMFSHVLPNVLGPVFVLATLHVGEAIITEATLSFLGVGVPPTQPSLGTLIQNGNNFLFSGEWWIIVFPSVALMILILSINIIGDWLRDALNPKLQ